MEKIISPKSKRPILIYGDTYNKLIKSGEYTEEFLLSLPKTTTIKSVKSTPIQEIKPQPILDDI
ncbi:MAG: hypothetical protein KGD67_13235, partial [Candidatus Lokiarchaeota archaeon]|nr:hypothetical protein [Candidatus Lokiarchaeota archaeon]